MRRLADAWKAPLTKGQPVYAATITLNGCGRLSHEPHGFIVGWDKWGDLRLKDIHLVNLWCQQASP